MRRVSQFVWWMMLLLAAACSRERPPGPVHTDDEPRQITRDFTTTESDSGVVEYVLRARVAKMYGGGVTRAEGLEVDFYERARKVSTLTAREGYVDDDGRLRAEGDVVVVSAEGYVLRSPSLWWDRKRNKIRTDDAFTVTKTGESFRGLGLTTGPNLDLIEVDKDFEGTVVDEGKR
jgi:LPS export ABC transporter protein LptC